MPRRLALPLAAACLALLVLALHPALAAVRVCPVASASAVPQLTGFYGADDKPAAVQTEATVTRRGDSLVFAVTCREPKMDQLVANCQVDDNPTIFSDDCLELFLSPTGEGEQYFHFVTNGRGARYDERGKGNPSWDAPWSAKAARAADCWTVEIAVPFSSLGSRPGAGSVWWFNLCRQRQPGGLQLSAYSPTDSNFHDLARFAVLTFDPLYAQYLRTRYLSVFDRRVAQLTARAAIRRRAARDLQETLAPVQATLEPLRQAAGSTAMSAEQFGAMLEVGAAALKRLETAETNVNNAVAGIEAARKMAALAPAGAPLLTYTVAAITDRQVLPVPVPPATLGKQLRLRACRGEYEPASFVVYPLRRTTTLEVACSALTGPGTIPASALDVRAVKCWYQSGKPGRFPVNEGLHLLTPELLLRDDSLIRIDERTGDDYVKLAYPDGRSRYLCISDPQGTPEEKDGRPEVLPIHDAATLQPVTIPARTAKQFWLTVRVPADTPAGRYQGTVRLLAAGQVLETLPLALEVLPFDLADNPLESSIYFHWGMDLDSEGPGTLKINKRNSAQYRAELQNLLAHGIDNPTISVHPKSGQLAAELKLRQEVGLRNDKLYYLVGYAGLPDEQLKQAIETAKGFGFREFYFYGQDEAQGDALKKQRERWEQIHALGGKVFVAGSPGQNFPLVGDLQDLLVCYGDPTREEAANWHSKAHRLFCYANPQAGSEVPETYRRNFGLLLAVNDYDGGMTYIYYSGWNDYSIGHYRQHNFVYPTVDGVIDTIQWEGYREGIDDLRYLGTLRREIARAQAAGGRAAAEAARAQAFLGRLNVSGDLDTVRSAMIDWIIRLQGS